MSAPPPPPAWPPPPVAYQPRAGAYPPAGPPVGPGSWWAFRPLPVREHLGRIREGIRWYLLVLLLNFLSAIAGAAFVGYVVGGVFSGSTANAPTAGAAVASGVSTALGLVGLLTLIFTIVSWLKWRSGIRPLPESAMEFGPAYWTAAESAKKDYGRTVWAFLSVFLASLIFIIAIVAYAVSQVINACGGLGANNTGCVSSSANVAGGVLGATLAFGLVVALLEFLMYYFSSRSLVDAIRLISGPAEQQRLDRGRLWMVVGAAITPVGLVNAALILEGHAFEPLAFVGILSPLLLLYGLYEIHGAYSAWLERRSPPPTGPPASGPPYAPPPVQPYSPPMAQPYGAPPPQPPPPFGPPGSR
jgi:hypothetical protein